MKTRNLRALTITGLAAGLLVSSHGISAEKDTPTAAQQSSETNLTKAASKTDAFDTAFEKYDGNITYHLMTEEELKRELTPAGQKIYDSLTPEYKELAKKVVSTTCSGMNPCKGFGGCRSKDNECSGKNKCEGKGTCATADKNVSVKRVYDRMMEKRAKVADN
jgi:hypothetical protein